MYKSYVIWVGIASKTLKVRIIIFKILVASTIFIIGLKQYTFKKQQNSKFIENNFYKFFKNLCFVCDKHE
jgi:hypothetical protein